MKRLLKSRNQLRVVKEEGCFDAADEHTCGHAWDPAADSEDIEDRAQQRTQVTLRFWVRSKVTVS